MSPTSYQAALPRVIPSLLSATLIIIPYSNSFVKRVRKVFLQQKQRMKTRLPTFFEPLPVKRTMKKTRFFLPRAIVFLAFQNAPESFHWAVVNAVGYTRHALCHARIFQHVVKSMTCVSHFSFGFCAWKSRFSLFSATCCGQDALRVQP